MKAGFGDIEITKWHLTDDLQGIVVTEAKLLAGQHAGPPLRLPGGYQMNPGQRLTGRKAFDHTLNALGVASGAGGAVLIAKNSDNSPAEEDPDATATGASQGAANATNTPGSNGGANPTNTTAAGNAPLDPNNPANWKIPADDVGNFGNFSGGGWRPVPPEQVNWGSFNSPAAGGSSALPPKSVGGGELVDLGPNGGLIRMPGDPDALLNVPEHPKSPTGISGELEGEGRWIPLPDHDGLTLDAVLATPGNAPSDLGPLPVPDPDAKWPICPKCGKRHDPNE